MVKKAAQSKLANKVGSKKNKKHLSKQNLNVLSRSAGNKVGFENNNKKGENLKKIKKITKAEANAVNEKIKSASSKEEDDIVLPDDDMISSEDESFGFLDSLANTKQIQKLEREKKRRLENDGESFEQGKRSFEYEVVNANQRRLLPVVDVESGRVKGRYAEIIKKEMHDEDEKSSDDNMEEDEPPLTADDILGMQKTMNETWPKRLANAASRAMSHPEQHAHAALRCFLQALSFGEERKYLPIRIRQMAMLSAGAILVDILPGYKITKLTEAQMKEKVKKDLKQLRTYEQGLLELYQKFLMRLDYFVKIYRNPKQLNTKHINQRRKQANEEEIDVLDYLTPEARLLLARSATKVFSKLTASTMGFNFHDNLLDQAVPLLNDKDEVIREEIKEGIIQVFRTDKLGENTLKIVQKIAQLTREKLYKTSPACLEILLRLKIKHVENKKGKDEKDKQRDKIDRNKVSRAQNKQRKREAKLMTELKDVEAVENQNDRLHFNSNTIQAIFGIYLRVLKSIRKSPLLQPALLGVAKFAHQINLELIAPLLLLLEDVFSDKSISVNSRLKAAKAACTILSGRGEDLLVDPKHLYKNAYIILDDITSIADENNSDPWPTLFDLLMALMIERKNHLNEDRVNAFLHKIITTAVRVLNEKKVEKSKDKCPYVLPLLLVAREMLIHHPCTHQCIDEEAELSSLPVDVRDPDLVQAKRVAVKNQLMELEKSGNTLVISLAAHLLKGAPSKAHLPNNMMRKRPMDLYKELRYRK